MRTSILAIALLFSSGCSGQNTKPHHHTGGLPESPTVNIPYESQTAALAALRVKPGVTQEEHGGEWLVFSDSPEKALWSLTKPGHFAHPTTVVRRIIEEDGQVVIGMDVKCGSSKANCDVVVQQFIELNNKISGQPKGP